MEDLQLFYYINELFSGSQKNLKLVSSCRMTALQVTRPLKGLNTDTAMMKDMVFFLIAAVCYRGCPAGGGDKV